MCNVDDGSGRVGLGWVGLFFGGCLLVFENTLAVKMLSIYT